MCSHRRGEQVVDNAGNQDSRQSAQRSPGLEVGDEGAGNASRSCFIAHLEWMVRLLKAPAPSRASRRAHYHPRCPGWEAPFPTGHFAHPEPLPLLEAMP